MDKTPINEAIKEWLRLVLIAITPVIVVGVDLTNGNFDINWQIVLAVGTVTLLRAIEKWLHEMSKKSSLKGLPF